MRIPSQVRNGMGGPALAAGLIAAAPAWAGPADVYYERALMSAAHARCGLFTPATARALEAGTAQARGAALRSGVGEADLNAVRARARSRAAATACDSAELRTAAERVRGAFEAWSRTARMEFPGQGGAWAVDRRAYRTPSWMVRQDAGSGANAVVFGYAGGLEGQALALAARGERYATARIVVRDPARAGTPWLPRSGMAATPPRSSSRVFIASGQTAAEPTLAPGGSEGAMLFRFPAAAADALSALDPRERFLVELVRADGTVRTVTLGVGDFAAARAFLAMGTL